MKTFTHEEYQDAYRKAWLAQNKIDARKNNMVISIPTPKPKIDYTDPVIARINGKKGGRPRTGNKTPLNEKARIINKMMLHGMTREAISSMMGESPVYIKKIEGRFGLPRDE